MADDVPFEASALVRSRPFQEICRHVRFAAGDLLRNKGEHYQEMYLLLAGEVEVDLGTNARDGKILVGGVGAPIGEIGFLRGSPATATVRARVPTEALVIDDPSLARLEREEPAATAALLRHLAVTAEERSSFNLTFSPAANSYGGASAIEVYLCRTAEALENAKRLRYDVYCRELGRNSPFADHQRKIITDALDDFGHTFVAVEAGETIGTMRGNLSIEGSLGAIEDIYGMRRSPCHPEKTAVCTKFIVKKAKRGGPTSIKLISAMVRFGLHHQVEECYIDCVPSLLPYYRAIGFTVAGERFFHRENGPSHPMVIDLRRHGARLARDGGARDYLKVFARAQAIRLLDHLRGSPPAGATRRGARR